MGKGRLTGLDGLRGIAALAVVAFHAMQNKDGRGYLAVDFFFMLSGYVMARTFEPRMGSVQAAIDFVSSRVRRLWPTVFVGSLFAVPWLLRQTGPDGWLVAALNLMLIPTPKGDGQLYVINTAAWSVLFELVLNAIHAALLWRLGQRALLLLLAGLVPLLAFWANTYGYDVVARGPWLLPVLTRSLVPYVMGILLYRWWRDSPTVRVPGTVTWLLMPVWFATAPLVAPDGWWLDLAFVLVACPLLVAGGLTHGAGSRVAAWAGALSFPLYAIHNAVLVEMRGLEAPWPLQVIASVVGAVALAALMRFVQRKPANPGRSMPVPVT